MFKAFTEMFRSFLSIFVCLEKFFTRKMCSTVKIEFNIMLFGNNELGRKVLIILCLKFRFSVIHEMKIHCHHQIATEWVWNEKRSTKFNWRWKCRWMTSSLRLLRWNWILIKLSTDIWRIGKAFSSSAATFVGWKQQRKNNRKKTREENCFHNLRSLFCFRFIISFFHVILFFRFSS